VTQIGPKKQPKLGRSGSLKKLQKVTKNTPKVMECCSKTDFGQNCGDAETLKNRLKVMEC
jgi:hypothetical protein